jgi:hypothetical protein
MNENSQASRQVASYRFLNHLAQKVVQSWIRLKTQGKHPAEIPWMPQSWPLADSTLALIIRWPSAQYRSALRAGRGATEPLTERDVLPNPAGDGDCWGHSPLSPAETPPRGGTRPDHAPAPARVAGA